MQFESPDPARYAVFEDDPSDCHEVGLTLAEAFHSIMAHCDYEPAWDVDGAKLRLRFRYLDEPFKGRFVGGIEPSMLIEKFQAPVFGGDASRERIMREVVSVGLRGWYAEPMAEFYRDSADIAGREIRYSGDIE